MTQTRSNEVNHLTPPNQVVIAMHISLSSCSFPGGSDTIVLLSPCVFVNISQTFSFSISLFIPPFASFSEENVTLVLELKIDSSQEPCPANGFFWNFSRNENRLAYQTF